MHIGVTNILNRFIDQECVPLDTTKVSKRLTNWSEKVFDDLNYISFGDRNVRRIILSLINNIYILQQYIFVFLHGISQDMYIKRKVSSSIINFL